MADFDIEKIARALSGMSSDDTPEEDEGRDNEPEEKHGPSFMPDLMSGREDGPKPSMKHRQSVLDTGTAISVVALIKRELSKINCTLKDYRIEFNVSGADINNISISTPSIEALRSKVKSLPDEEKARVSNKVTTMALIAIKDALAEKLRQDLGLEAQLFEYDNADIGAVALKEAKPEDELSELPDLPPMPMGMPGSEGMPIEPDLEAAPEMEPAPLAGPAGEAPPPPPEAGAAGEVSPIPEPGQEEEILPEEPPL